MIPRGEEDLIVQVLYLDESGDHNLVKIDRSNPYFVIGGIIVDRNYDRTVLEPRVRQFKMQWFGLENVVFHSTDLSAAINGFESLRTDRLFRHQFFEALTELMVELDYRVIACLINKRAYVEQHRERARDPYELGLEVVIERFCSEIGETPDGGIIFAEKRRPDLDHALDIAWESLCRTGPRSIGERIVGLSLKAKSVNIAGLQLADLVLSPISRHARGLDTHGNWEIVRSKMRLRSEAIEGSGFVILSK